MMLHLVAQPLGERYRRIENRSGENQQKFFATVASHAVDVSGLSLEELSKLPQHRVAGLLVK